MKRPMALLYAVATILFLEGLASTVSKTVQMSGFMVFPPSSGIINMIAGFGLLKFWRIARFSSLMVIFAEFCGALMGIYISIFPDRFSPHQFFFWGKSGLGFTLQSPVAITSLIIAYTVLIGWMFYVLNRRDVRELFQQPTAATI